MRLPMYFGVVILTLKSFKPCFFSVKMQRFICLVDDSSVLALKFLTEIMSRITFFVFGYFLRCTST